MELKEIEETVSKQDVKEVCDWLTQIDGVDGANRVAEAIRNCYSEAEQVFGPGKDKSFVAQKMLEISHKKRVAVQKLLCGASYFILMILVVYKVLQGVDDHYFLMVYGDVFYSLVMVTGFVAGGLSWKFLHMIIGALGELFWYKKRYQIELVLIKYYARCADLSDENEKLKIELQQLREGDR